MKYSLEYCSLYYLNMWLKHDRLYHEALNNGDHNGKLKAIKDVAAEYRIARNLPTKYEKNCARYAPILEIIDKVMPVDFEGDAEGAIEKVEGEISKVYGDRTALSATTKFLWFRVRNPIIIYDSQVRKALKTPAGNLRRFYEAWRVEYNNRSGAISNACANLSSVAGYSYDQTIATSSYVQGISAEPWFQERVLDVYLWHKGQ